METIARGLKKVVLVIGVIALLLIFRLAYIQLVGGEELAEATRAQSLIALKGGNTRGMIYDRNGAALVADKERYIYIIKENRLSGKAEAMLESVGADEVSGGGDGYRVYSSERYEKGTGRGLIRESGAYILRASARYDSGQTAEHLIGYVNGRDSSGAAGLELMYDDRLARPGRHVYAVADVKGNILPGRGLIVTRTGDSRYPGDELRTTVDKRLQAAVEEIIDGLDNDCAVVVLDSRSGGVEAMACTPRFDPNDISGYIDSPGEELINKATQGEYAPGSVFKIVVAAAALEKGIDIDTSFECAGGVSVGNLDIGCETGGDSGHGTISFEEAFAVSCNSFFIRLGQQVGADSISDMAERMGLGKRRLAGYPQEASGHLMTEGERSGDAIGNLSIGQGETLTTPIQIAAMTNIIATGGIDRGVHILMPDGSEDRQVISGTTAERIGDMMERTTVYGTAASLEMTDENGDPDAAVKTGTAEYADGDEVSTNAWMTGYTPCDEAEYVITVFVKGGESGSGSAGPVFKKIVEYLRDSGSYSKPTLA